MTAAFVLIKQRATRPTAKVAVDTTVAFMPVPRKLSWPALRMAAAVVFLAPFWPLTVPLLGQELSTRAAARGRAAWQIRESYLDAARRQGSQTLPLGVFDSGTGGLAVLEEILRLDAFDNVTHTPRAKGDGRPDFEAERFVFLADQANMPYGNYPAAGKRSFLVELTLKDACFLLGNDYSPHPRRDALARDKSPAKVIVIACNTATAHGKRDIESLIGQAEIDVPLINVIDAGAEGAIQAIAATRGCVGVLATRGTVDSGAYPAAIERLARQAGMLPPVVFQQGSLGLAGAIDGVRDFLLPTAHQPRPDYRGPSLDNPDARIDAGLLPRYDFDFTNGQMLWQGEPQRPGVLQINSVENYIAYEVVSLMEPIRRRPDVSPLAAVVLGCTHFPYFTDVFRSEVRRLRDYQENGQHVYRHLLREDVQWIDPATTTARQLYARLAQDGKLRVPRDATAGMSRGEFYITVPNVDHPEVRLDSTGGFTYEYKYGRHSALGETDVRVVPLTARLFDAKMADRVRRQLPWVWTLLEEFRTCNAKVRPETTPQPRP